MLSALMLLTKCLRLLVFDSKVVWLYLYLVPFWGGKPLKFDCVAGTFLMSFAAWSVFLHGRFMGLRFLVTATNTN